MYRRSVTPRSPLWPSTILWWVSTFEFKHVSMFPYTYDWIHDIWKKGKKHVMAGHVYWHATWCHWMLSLFLQVLSVVSVPVRILIGSHKTASFSWAGTTILLGCYVTMTLCFLPKVIYGLHHLWLNWILPTCYNNDLLCYCKAWCNALMILMEKLAWRCWPYRNKFKILHIKLYKAPINAIDYRINIYAQLSTILFITSTFKNINENSYTEKNEPNDLIWHTWLCEQRGSEHGANDSNL